MDIMSTFARVVGATRNKTHNSFSARGGKKVAHHWSLHHILMVMFWVSFVGFECDFLGYQPQCELQVDMEVDV